MSVEGPLLAAVIARLGDAKTNLAAYGLAFAVALVVESPIINMLTAATALVKDRLSYAKLRRFVYVLNLVISLLMLIIGATPLFLVIARDWIGLPTEVAQLARTAILVLLPWPGAIGYRRFYQGVLISAGQTRRVAAGTLIRLVSMSSTALSLAAFSNMPGALVGAASLSVAVIVEALAVRWMASEAIGMFLGRAPSQESHRMSMLSIARFYYPLAVTSILALAVHPMVSFLAGMGRLPLESLAVLPVIQSLVFIFRALGLSYQEVAVALLGRKEIGRARLGRFAFGLGAATSSALIVIAFTPLSLLWFGSVSGLPRELALFAIAPTQVLSLIPATTVLLVWQRSLLVHSKRTSPITWASGLEVATIVSAMLFGLFVLDWNGALSASVAFLVGRLAACFYLWAENRGRRRRMGAVKRMGAIP